MPSVANRGGGRGRRTINEINMVPFIDVMLVLLIIFMVAAPMMTQGMAVNLPKAARANAVTGQPIYITVPATFATDRRVQIGNEEIRIEALEERVKQALLERTDKSLFVRGDGAVAYKEIVYVFDRLRAAGVEKVGLLTEPAPKK